MMTDSYTYLSVQVLRVQLGKTVQAVFIATFHTVRASPHEGCLKVMSRLIP